MNKVIDILVKPNPGQWSPSPDHHLALMVNNLGGLGVLELNVIAEETNQQLSLRGLRVTRLIVGTFLTSLDGPGFSLTLLELDDELKILFDAPCSAPAWPRSTPDTLVGVESQVTQSPATNEQHTHTDSQLNGKTFLLKYGLRNATDLRACRHAVPMTLISKIGDAVARAVQADEPRITEYDTLAGDGDCGETLLKGVRGRSLHKTSDYMIEKLTSTLALREEIQTIRDDTVPLYEIIRRAAVAAERGMGGTSGAIYAIFLNALANALRLRAYEATWAVIPAGLEEALSELYKYTLARKGHRTLMDALIPFVENFREEGVEGSYDKARQGAESTRQMAAAMGRASYVNQDVFDRKGGIPDPGALGVVSVIRGICEGFKG